MGAGSVLSAFHLRCSGFTTTPEGEEITVIIILSHSSREREHSSEGLRNLRQTARSEEFEPRAVAVPSPHLQHCSIEKLM